MNEPTSSRRLQGGTKASLAASIKALPHGERGWITMNEAAALFSPKNNEYAFGAESQARSGPHHFGAPPAPGSRLTRSFRGFEHHAGRHHVV
jgi:hypothetical protein